VQGVNLLEPSGSVQACNGIILPFLCTGRLHTAVNKTLSDIISSFKANFLSLNINKTYYLEFRTKNCIYTTLHMNYFNKTIVNVPYTKFVGVLIDDTLSWDNYIHQIISRFNSASYAIRAVTAMLSRIALRMLYVSYMHFVMYYSIIFFGVTLLIVLKYSECEKKNEKLWLIETI